MTLRKLVEEARKQNKAKDAIRQSQKAAYKFMSAMAGDLPHFKEASRARFARVGRRMKVGASAFEPNANP